MTTGYDFVVVGGGTAGLVVASRLSEFPDNRVLVLEAGSDHTEDPRVKTPIFYSALLGSEADWAFRSKPQVSLRHCLRSGACFIDTSFRRASTVG